MKTTILIFLLFPSLVFSDCNISLEEEFFFSSSLKKDKFVSSIKGDCENAVGKIEIISHNGIKIFESELSTAVWESETKIKTLTKELAEKKAKWSFSPYKFESTHELPAYYPPGSIEWKNTYFYEALLVSPEYYKELRKMDWVTYTMNSGYEGLETITYDRNKNKVVWVAKGSP
ncbi:MAG: hypothetical protein GY707_08495 [Desulfobacteraceae bacterium]|nr:hypothetical protein [Desulfobacteraceae bacterium]